MKILMIAPTPFHADRGCHTQIHLEIMALQERGHEVVLCTYGLGKEVDGVTTVRCANYPWYTKLSAGPSITKIFLLPLLLFTSIKTIFHYRPQIVHAHLHEGAVIARICQFLFPQVKYIFDLQGSLTGECAQHGFVRRGSLGFKFLSWFEKRICQWFPVLTQSESMVSELQDLGVERKRIANIKDAVDTNLFKPTPFDTAFADKWKISSEHPRVLYMGLMETYQGVDVLFEAFSQVAKEFPKTQFLVIGYPNLEKYQDLAKSLGIFEQTTFFGKVNYFELTRYLSLSSIAMAPKIATTEGDGKIYNYMAMGMTTIAFDRSVSREILGRTARFAKFGDASALAKEILWSLRNPEEAAELGRAARQRAVEELSWQAVGKRIVAAYENLLEVDEAPTLGGAHA